MRWWPTQGPRLIYGHKDEKNFKMFCFDLQPKFDLNLKRKSSCEHSTSNSISLPFTHRHFFYLSKIEQMGNNIQSKTDKRSDMTFTSTWFKINACHLPKSCISQIRLSGEYLLLVKKEIFCDRILPWHLTYKHHTRSLHPLMKGTILVKYEQRAWRYAPEKDFS